MADWNIAKSKIFTEVQGSSKTEYGQAANFKHSSNLKILNSNRQYRLYPVYPGTTDCFVGLTDWTAIPDPRIAFAVFTKTDVSMVTGW